GGGQPAHHGHPHPRLHAAAVGALPPVRPCRRHGPPLRGGGAGAGGRVHLVRRPAAAGDVVGHAHARVHVGDHLRAPPVRCHGARPAPPIGVLMGGLDFRGPNTHVTRFPSTASLLTRVRS